LSDKLKREGKEKVGNYQTKTVSIGGKGKKGRAKDQKGDPFRQPLQKKKGRLRWGRYGRGNKLFITGAAQKTWWSAYRQKGREKT